MIIPEEILYYNQKSDQNNNLNNLQFLCDYKEGEDVCFKFQTDFFIDYVKKHSLSKNINLQQIDDMLHTYIVNIYSIYKIEYDKLYIQNKFYNENYIVKPEQIIKFDDYKNIISEYVDTQIVNLQKQEKKQLDTENTDNNDNQIFKIGR